MRRLPEELRPDLVQVASPDMKLLGPPLLCVCVAAMMMFSTGASSAARVAPLSTTTART
jgi:hypothetical protein